MPSKVAFIGLGTMGLPMAVNLSSAGFDVTGYNRSPHKAQALAQRGGQAASSIAAAVDGADAVITMLPDSPDVETVLLGEGGVFATAPEGALVIDMSTIIPETARALAQEGEKRGFCVLDAPVSGGESGAIAGKLAVMVGGPKTDVEAAAPLFEAVGATFVRVGPAGAGQTVKAANQLIVAGNLQLVAEALVFLEGHGVDAEAAMSVLGGGMAGSAVLEQKGAGMRQRRFEPGFRAELHDKDMRIATSAAREAGVAIPVAALAAQFMAALCAQGDGALDHSALLKIVEQLSGRQSPS
ncbi:2-hydroxy-3-oxopropionate reductase [Salinactinospora qingdaonensis]|uniref:2-hydroxy-3-oxopropionate reductase n=2 Tax=Salinactinospora qingdaonensis TaxID=702744 RepID=A0ABP7GD60_9ACTN